MAFGTGGARVRSILVAVAGLVALPATVAQTAVTSKLADLSLEELSNIEVTSVSGRVQSLQDAPASIYVITGEDIRRSSATSLPEALRLAPNLQVGQLNAAQYAISARGFNNAIGNKLLVLIDGRTVYSPLFSGVFWDSNDVMLEDVDRIEVISGPGGTIWGANAVNGVINVITRTAHATQGTLGVVSRSGDRGYEAARFGGSLGEAGHFRIYAQAMDRNNTQRADAFERPDAASKRQIGFRADLGRPGDGLTLQGDLYRGGKEPGINLAPKLRGANLRARWTSRTPDGSPIMLQAYLDRAERDETAVFRNHADTVDFQFSHEPIMQAPHQLLWGAGYRRTRDRNDPSTLLAFIPATRTLAWSNIFAQYQHRITPSVEATLGAKLERNVYTGVEFLPSARLAWTHTPKNMTWTALSRAVRAPARLDREFFLPAQAPYSLAGGASFDSEVANVIEAGHRGFARGASYSITAFHQRYDRLRSSSSTVPRRLENGIEGSISGLESWASWQVSRAWRLGAGYLALHKALRLKPGSSDTSGIASLGNDPRRQWSLRSNIDLGSGGEFDLMLRHVGALPSPSVPRYTAVDARIGWNLKPGVDVSLLAQNLLDRRHVEFNDVAVASQIERRVFLKLAWAL